MRIGIVSVSYLPRLGGAVTQVLLLHRELTRRGHSVEVFCPDLNRTGRFDENGITVNRVAHRWITDFHSNTCRMAMLWHLRQAVQRRRNDFDVFISAEFNIGALTLSFTNGTNTVGTYGADFVFEYVNYVRSKTIAYEDILRRNWGVLGFKLGVVTTALYALQRFLFYRLDHTVVVNDQDLRRLSAVSRRVSKIPFLIERPVPNPTWTNKPRSVPQILTVIGRAVSWKAIPRSLELALKIKTVFPDLEIHYFGTGPDLPKIENNFGKVITIHKEAANSDILAHLETSDITVNLSEYETFCLVNAEAMTRRSLMLVRPLAEYDYLTNQQNCIFVTAENFQTLPETLKGLFGSPRLRSLLDQAQRTIEQLYPIERCVAGLEELFQQVIDREASGRSRPRAPART